MVHRNNYKNKVIIGGVIECLIVLFVCLMGVSLLMAIANIKRSSNTRLTSKIKQILQQSLECLWKNFLLFFYEPYLEVTSSWPSRILLMTWLTCVTVLYIELSSNLKSEFIDTKYYRIDSVEDALSQDSSVKIAIMKGGTEEKLVKEKAFYDVNYAQLQSKLTENENSLIEAFDLIMGDTLDEIADGHLNLITSELTVVMMLAAKLTGPSFFDYMNRYYFSQSLDNTFMVYLYHPKFVGTELANVADAILRINLESRLDYLLFSRSAFIKNVATWMEPIQTNDQLTFEGVESVLQLYLWANCINAVVFLITYLWTTIAVLC